MTAPTSPVVAITGAARGIGRATAAALARSGAQVAVGDLDAGLACDAAAAIGAGSIGLGLDVRSGTSFAAFLDQTSERLGPLDVLVNNAGIMRVGAFVDQDEGAADDMIDVNLRGVIIGTQLALAQMLPRGHGHIVNVASSVGKVALPGVATYAATKSAVIALSDALRAELRGTGIDVSCVMPGIVDTELAHGLRRPRGVPVLTPDQVADAVVALLDRPRGEVILPRRAAAILRAAQILPSGARGRLLAAVGADAAMTGADRDARAAYEARAAGAGDLSASAPRRR